jgi:phosphatidate cytidylyltransferase
MAFNLQTFRTRTITSFIFIVVMLTGLLLNQWSFFLLFSIIHFGAWTEFQKIIGLINPVYKQINPLHKNTVMLAGWGFMLWMCDSSFMLGQLNLQQIGFWLMLSCIIAFPLSEFLLGGKAVLQKIGYSVLGLFYISLAWGLMMDLYTIYFEWRLPLIIIIVIWVNDTMAYLVGSMIGKTPLSKISPKKTWEGTLGGILLSIITIWVFYLHEEKSLQL